MKKMSVSGTFMISRTVSRVAVWTTYSSTRLTIDRIDSRAMKIS